MINLPESTTDQTSKFRTKNLVEVDNNVCEITMSIVKSNSKSGR